MRTEQERADKLAECLTHARPKYGKNGDCSAWTYWHEFAVVLRAVSSCSIPARCIRMIRNLAHEHGHFQRAAMYSWLLEEPTPTITEKGRAVAIYRARMAGRPFYLWADKLGTHSSEKQPKCRCEVIEPKVKPRKRKKFLYGPSQAEFRIIPKKASR